MKYFYLMIISFLLMACGVAETNKEIEDKDALLTDAKEKIIEETKKEDAPISLEITEEMMMKFVPENHRIVRWKAGNLNMDERDDAILVIEKLDVEDETGTTGSTDNPDDVYDEKRSLLILIMNEKGVLEEATRNDKVIMCSHCGGIMGDPFGGAGDIVIKNGYFSIESMGGSRDRWVRIITFKYNRTKKGWFLHKDGYITWDSLKENSEEETVYSTKDFGVVPFESYNYKNKF